VKKTTLILIILFLSISVGYTQKISTNLHVTPHYCDTMKSICFYKIIIDVNQELIIEDFQQDTFVLTLEHYFSMQMVMYPFLFQKISVTYEEGNREVSLPYEFYGTDLSFVLPASSCKINLSYQCVTDYFCRAEGAPSYFMPYHFSWNSWYFTCPDMEISKVEIANYESVYMIINLPLIKKDNKIILDASAIDYKEGITIHLLEKKYYEKITFQEKTNIINIFIHKGEIRIYKEDDPILYDPYPGNRLSKKLVNRYITEVKNVFKQLNTFFSPLEQSEINIYEADLTMKTDNGHIQWGVSIPVWKNNKFSILIDTSAVLYTNTMIHELIHIYYNRILPPESDSTHLFFGEGMTEYLAKCFKYRNLRQRDSIFNQAMIDFARMNYDEYSIFKVSDNSMAGSSQVIYLKTPFIIHTFAQMMGEEKFLNIVSLFYKEAKQRNEISFIRFEELLKENGITDKQWEWFVKSL
jgi:hypothetical protein